MTALEEARAYGRQSMAAANDVEPLLPHMPRRSPAPSYMDAPSIGDRLAAATMTTNELKAQKPPPALIEGFLLLDSTAVIYGPSGSGKTFHTVDFAGHGSTVADAHLRWQHEVEEWATEAGIDGMVLLERLGWVDGGIGGGWFRSAR